MALEEVALDLDVLAGSLGEEEQKLEVGVLDQFEFRGRRGKNGSEKSAPRPPTQRGRCVVPAGDERPGRGSAVAECWIDL